MGDGLGARTASGLAMAAIAVLAALYGAWAFTLLVAVVGILLANEWDRLCGGSGIGVQAIAHGAAIAATAVLAGAGLTAASVLAIGAGAAATASAASAGRRSVAWAVGGLLYTSIPALALIWLREYDRVGQLAVLWLFAVIWSTDTGAYLIGKAVGGPKLAPRVSPGKTWAGTVGGLAAAALAGAVVAGALGWRPIWAWFLGSVLLSAAGQAGDLGKSRIKRHFGVKDSGHIIPGHGGVLDRVDSTLASAPLAAAGVFVAELWGLRWP